MHSCHHHSCHHHTYCPRCGRYLGPPVAPVSPYWPRWWYPWEYRPYGPLINDPLPCQPTITSTAHVAAQRAAAVVKQ